MSSYYNRLMDFYRNLDEKSGGDKYYSQYPQDPIECGKFIYDPTRGIRGTHTIKWMSTINLSRTGRHRNVSFYLTNYQGHEAPVEVTQRKSPTILILGNYI